MQSGSVGQFLTLQYTPPRPRYNFSRSEVIPAAIIQSTRGRGGRLDQQPESHSDLRSKRSFKIARNFMRVAHICKVQRQLKCRFLQLTMRNKFIVTGRTS